MIISTMMSKKRVLTPDVTSYADVTSGRSNVQNRNLEVHFVINAVRESGG